MKTKQHNAFNTTVGKFLRQKRTAKRYSFEYVSEMTGIPPATLKRYEYGQSSIPEGRLQKICDLYGLNRKEITKEASYLASMPNDKDMDSRLLNAFSKLTKSEKESVVTIAESMSNGRKLI